MLPSVTPSVSSSDCRRRPTPASEVDAASGARVAKPSAIVHAISPECGRALVYYHQVLHAGAVVGRGCRKYCLRTDVMYRREPAQGTAPNDVEAWTLIQRARECEARGAPMEALPLYMRAKKLSKVVARAYRIGFD